MKLFELQHREYGEILRYNAWIICGRIYSSYLNEREPAGKYTHPMSGRYLMIQLPFRRWKATLNWDFANEEAWHYPILAFIYNNNLAYQNKGLRVRIWWHRCPSEDTFTILKS